MKYLIDTDIVVNHLRAKKIIQNEWVVHGTEISIITYGELLALVRESRLF